jgi:hypothetical protein
MISLYVNALLCTLQRMVIHEMQLSGVNTENCICICLISCTESETDTHVGLRDGGLVFRAPPCIFYNKFCFHSRGVMKKQKK